MAMMLHGFSSSLPQSEYDNDRSFMRAFRQRVRRSKRQKRARLKERVVKLEKEVDELKLFLAALIRYNTSKSQLDIAEFKEFVAVIDESDGERDGEYDGDIA